MRIRRIANELVRSSGPARNEHRNLCARLLNRKIKTTIKGSRKFCTYINAASIDTQRLAPPGTDARSSPGVALDRSVHHISHSNDSAQTPHGRHDGTNALVYTFKLSPGPNRVGPTYTTQQEKPKETTRNNRTHGRARMISEEAGPNQSQLRPVPQKLRKSTCTTWEQKNTISLHLHIHKIPQKSQRTGHTG